MTGVCNVCGSRRADASLPCPTCGERSAPHAYVNVGSDPRNDLVLVAPFVAPFHARVYLNPAGRFVVEDLDSPEGVFVNGVRVHTSEFGWFDDVRLGNSLLPMAHRAISGLLLSPTRAIDSSVGFTLGSAPTCDVVVTHPSVAPRHAFVRTTVAGEVDVYDESAGRLYVDRRGYPIESARVLSNSLIWLGDCSIPCAALLQRLANVDRASPHHRLLRASARKSLELVDDGAAPIVVSVPAPTRPRIAISLDAVSLDVVDRVTGTKKRLIEDVSLSAMPGQLVGLLGPSGAGKSTLLQVLLGLALPTSGGVRVNDRPMREMADAFRANLGYVPQDDIVHADLTVGEALEYACRLRMPSDTTRAVIDAAVERTLVEVGLLEHRHSLIGSAEDKVLSGGQRRRVNLAVELVTDPAVLILDEPTSGLSWTDAADVIATLRRLADAGRTILLTIHQPDVQEYETFDSVAILGTGGRLLFFGPPKPDSYDFFGAESGRPRSIFDRLEQFSPETWQTRYRGSDVHRRFGTTQTNIRMSQESPLSPTTRTSFFSQFRTVFERTVRITLRQRASTTLMLVQAPLLGLLIALSASNVARVPIGGFGCLPPSDPNYFDTCVGSEDVYACDSQIAFDALMQGRPSWTRLDEDTQSTINNGLAFRRLLIRDPRSVLLSILLAVFLPMVIVSATTLVSERSIYLRERLAGLAPFPYVLARFCVLSALGILVAVLHLGVAVPMLDLQGNFGIYLGLGSLVAAAAVSMGLMLSAIVRRPAAALWGVNLLIVPQMLFAGTVTRLDGTTDLVSRFTTTRPALEALARLHLESAEVEGHALAGCQIARWLESLPGYATNAQHPVAGAVATLSLLVAVGLALAIGFTSRRSP